MIQNVQSWQRIERKIIWVKPFQGLLSSPGNPFKVRTNSYPFSLAVDYRFCTIIIMDWKFNFWAGNGRCNGLLSCQMTVFALKPKIYTSFRWDAVSYYISDHSLVGESFARRTAKWANRFPGQNCRSESAVSCMHPLMAMSSQIPESFAIDVVAHLFHLSD